MILRDGDLPPTLENLVEAFQAAKKNNPEYLHLLQEVILFWHQQNVHNPEQARILESEAAQQHATSDSDYGLVQSISELYIKMSLLGSMEKSAIARGILFSLVQYDPEVQTVIDRIKHTKNMNKILPDLPVS